MDINITILETCKTCNKHLILMTSIRHPDGILCLVKRCPNGCIGAEEICELKE